MIKNIATYYGKRCVNCNGCYSIIYKVYEPVEKKFNFKARTSYPVVKHTRMYVFNRQDFLVRIRLTISTAKALKAEPGYVIIIECDKCGHSVEYEHKDGGNND